MAFITVRLPNGSQQIVNLDKVDKFIPWDRSGGENASSYVVFSGGELLPTIHGLDGLALMIGRATSSMPGRIKETGEY